MKFDYKFDLSKWFNSKAGLIFSLIIEALLLFVVSIEMYTGESDFMLMAILAVYLIDSAVDSCNQLKELGKGV